MRRAWLKPSDGPEFLLEHPFADVHDWFQSGTGEATFRLVGNADPPLRLTVNRENVIYIREGAEL